MKAEGDDNPCLGVSDLVMLPIPSNCTFFIVCMKENPNPVKCPANLFFNSLESRCDLEENANCLTTPGVPATIMPVTTTTVIPTTTTTTTTPIPTTSAPTSTTTFLPTSTTIPTTISLSTIDPITMNTSTTEFPLEVTTTDEALITTSDNHSIDSNSTTTIATSSTIPSIQSTTEEIPSGQQTTATPPPTSADHEIERGIICPESNQSNDDQSAIYLSSNIDCAKYYICNNGEPQPMYCQIDLHWNPKTKSCQSQWNAKCTISENNYPETFPLCEREKMTFHPYPLLCDRFLYCYYGHMTTQYCPYFHHWDISTESCVWKTETKCGSFI